MNSPTLIETRDPDLIKRGSDFGLKVAANLVHVLSREDLEWWEKNLPDIQPALRKGFSLNQLGQSEAPLAKRPPRPFFAFADTNASTALNEAEEFAEQFFGHRSELGKQFTMPETLLWKEVIAVYDPGTLTHRRSVDQALKSQPKLKGVYEERDLMDYKDAKATGKPTLRFIERSTQPTPDTMNLTADEMVATKRTFLDLRGYIIAFGMYHRATGHFIDPKTWTRFPTSRLPGGGVARGYWNPDHSKVLFYWCLAGRRSSRIGGREAVECSLAT